MSSAELTDARHCFIAAPIGLSLGALPSVLDERGISWEWASSAVGQILSPIDAIKRADFIIAIFDGSSGDKQASFEAGAGVGLGKPLFVIGENRHLPFELRQISTSRIPLRDRAALKFHLDIFLQTPKRRVSEYQEYYKPPLPPSNELQKDSFLGVDSELERRAFQIVEAAGGRAVAQPGKDIDAPFRPDLLAWLGHQDAELLDPTVIEIKRRVDGKQVRKLENQLLQFLQATGIRTAFVVTLESPPKTFRPISPYIYWLSLNEFESLAQRSLLGRYVRDTRNRVVHGAK